MEIPGSTALVTGAARRIGREIALSLAAAGAEVAIHWHTSEREAEETVRQIRALGRRAEGLQADLSLPTGCQTLWDDATRSMGVSPRILVNNASRYEIAGFRETNAEVWDRAMAVNVKAPFLLARKLDNALEAGAQGKIVNINDTRRVYRSRFAYGVSNFALTGLTRSLAVNLASRIQVNELLLGPILPPVNAMPDAESGIDELASTHQMEKLDAVSEAVIALIANDRINGASLRVDGGLGARH